MSTIELSNKNFYNTIEQYQKWQKYTEKWVYKTMCIPKKYLENNETARFIR